MFLAPTCDIINMSLCVFSGGADIGTSIDISKIIERMNSLKKDISKLQQEEQRLDKDKVIVDHYIEQITVDLLNQK